MNLPMGPTGAAGVTYNYNNTNKNLATTLTVVVPENTKNNNAAVSPTINWTSFNIGIGDSVIFDLPTATSSVTNRVSSNVTIAGNLRTSQGGFFLDPTIGASSDGALQIASYNITFTNTAHVTASSISIMDTSTTNAGVIQAADDIRLSTSGSFTNTGVITSDNGKVSIFSIGPINESGDGSISAGTNIDIRSGAAINIDNTGDGAALSAKDKIELNANGGMVNLNGHLDGDLIIKLNGNNMTHRQLVAATLVNNNGVTTANHVSINTSTGEVTLGN